MKLSFCIPTYNRCQFLKKNIDIIIQQIHELSVEKDVEILINDNASPDDTEKLCLRYIEDNPDIHIEYYKNEKNEGPDWNFIKAMRLAHGEYSILFGDDDFLIDGALKEFIYMIDRYRDVSIFSSNRICVDSDGKIIGEEVFNETNKDIKIFNFSEEDSIRSFFYGVKSLGGILTFISTVIYKTEIIAKYPFDNNIIGSNYAFMYYWWNELLSGGKLCHLNKSYVLATTTGSTNNNYGQKVKRALVDYKGIPMIINSVTDDNTVKNYFYRTIGLNYPYINLQELYLKEMPQFEEELEPLLLKYGWSSEDLNYFKYSVSPRRMLVSFFCLFIKPILFRFK